MMIYILSKQIQIQTVGRIWNYLCFLYISQQYVRQRTLQISLLAIFWVCLLIFLKTRGWRGRFREIKIQILLTLKNSIIKIICIVFDAGNIKEQSKWGKLK